MDAHSWFKQNNPNFGRQFQTYMYVETNIPFTLSNFATYIGLFLCYIQNNPSFRFYSAAGKASIEFLSLKGQLLGCAVICFRWCRNNKQLELSLDILVI